MLRSLPLAGVLILGGLTAFNASAQRYDDGQYRPDPRYDDGQYRPGNAQNNNGPTYDYARVMRVDPIIVGGNQGSYERCYQRSDGDYVQGNNGNGYRNDGYRNDGYADRGYDDGSYRQGTDTGRQIATVIGGLAGAVLGSQIGGGDGRYIGTAVGTLAGGAAGRAIYEANNRTQDYRRGDVRVCEPSGYGSESERVDGYDVTYEYAGREYHTRRDYHPGERIRVRVDVSAD
ncbi:MAG: glycine zipper 2TM domain-containing protein [Stenotrophomonas sp.]|uniref:glycine zipper 2TM domain-containing protein n=1 Tax=Stenotrophomonas sp. TaxID=69392 RepID=UPI003D6D1ED6